MHSFGVRQRLPNCGRQAREDVICQHLVCYADAVAFVVHAPGAPMENFSRAAAALAADGSVSMEAVLAIAQRHGIELLGEIPALS